MRPVEIQFRSPILRFGSHAFDLIKALQADQTVFKGDVVAIITTNGAFAFHGFLLLLNTLYAEQCCKHNVLCL